ncbi:phytanoyl-CoA dioxygenase family protein [Actinacidiphila sp. ITFR-21]|uniref:phytanoyl-CoA dioxygenase family protein n=1 Tax=Actinacidiphila sp. ITFR-21 TaxID=3075199 RepID=UPI00288A5474|nr:phytanoyl-CoA dioxygenase family protein [Streptomyces sp. ITFR-21]WNI14843.1 phytanoyl-CoA dioxygenase family protein [Streptomyces sp. ITFR-21]
MRTGRYNLDIPYFFDAAAARARFDAEGFVKLPCVLDPAAVTAYEPAITAKVVELNTQHLPLAERDTYGKAFLQVTNLWQHSETVRELVFAERLAGIAAALLGVPSVRLYHDQALYKEPGGGITPWHADQYYWPLSTDRTVTLWLPLQETPAEMGPLAFAAGSHRFAAGRDLPIGDESEREVRRALAGQDFPVVESPYRLGEASFHGGWTFHRAAPNRSRTARRVMTVIYMAADITATEPVNDFQRHDLETWLPGTAVGAVPVSPLNPVLYPRASREAR